MLLLSGIVPNIAVQPASAATPTPSSMNALFGPSIYKVLVHVNGADKGEISPYYHRYLAEYAENEYDQVLFNMDHNLLTIPASSQVPASGGFESMSSWTTESTSQTVPGTYISEQSTAKRLNGSYSLHNKAIVPGTSLGYSGKFQDMLWLISPVAADLNLKFALFPVTLQDTTSSPDSLIVIALDFNHYDSATTVPQMFLVLQDDPTEALSSEESFVNDTNTVYYILNKQTSLQFNAWNKFNFNFTDLAVSYFGQLKAFNLKIDGIHIDAYSRNNATSEFYADDVRFTSSNTNSETYSALSQVVEAYDTPDLRMVPGEKLELSLALLYFNINTFFQPAGYSAASVKTTIDNIHARGDYVFVSKPTNTAGLTSTLKNNLFSVDGISAYSTRNTGPKGFSTDVWDYILNKGILAMGIAEQHPMYKKDVEYSATYAPTQFIYAPSNDAATSVEAMAQGRSYVEYGYIRPTMPIFFSAENQVPMGKFPIYVDTSRSTASLDINLVNIPTAVKTLKLIRNGSTISTVSLSGLTSYSANLTPSLPDKSNYFRLEIVDVNGNILAFSNPIVYVKKAITPDIWLALTPSLQYGSAKSSLDSISYENDVLNFTAKSKDTITVTTKIFTSTDPASVTGALSWNYDNSTKILSVNSKGVAQISIDFSVILPPPNTGTLSVNTTPVNGKVFVDGLSWGAAPVSNDVNNGSHIVSFGPVAGYTTPSNMTVTVTIGHNTSVTGTYILVPTNGTLSITSTPVNGTVFVDNTSWGTAPVSKSVAAGTYTISFSSVSGYTTPANITVSITAGENISVTATYTLIPPSNGTLSVSTTPVNGTVFVNGIFWGIAPVSEPIVEGSHTVSFGTVTNYTKPANITVVVTAGQNVSVTGVYTVIPPPSNGTLAVNTTPVNGEVFVNGTSWGIAPVSKSIAAGSYAVSFGVMSGYITPANVTVSISAGQNISVIGNYTLVPPPVNGTLLVSTTPVNGEVYVDNISWGVAPVNKSIVTGSHTVSFGEVSGYTKPVNVTVSVNTGENVLVTGNYTLIPPPPPSNGTLTVTTTPVDGAVYVDGELWGSAPVSKALAPGSYTVSFGSVSGYITPANVTVSVTSEVTTSVTGMYVFNPPSNPTYTLSFQGYDFNNKGEVSVLVNNQVVATLPTSYSPQNANVYVDFSLNITNYVVAGSNTVTFRQNMYSGGVRNVVVISNSSAVIYSNSTYYNLWTGGKESITYKFNTSAAPPSSPPNTTSYTITWEGYDYDSKQEVTVTLNGQVIGILPSTWMSANNDMWKSFSITTDKMQSGSNTLTFTQNLYSSKIRNLVIKDSNGTTIYSSAEEYSLWLPSKPSTTYNFSVP